jgi:hypothetical protein
VDEGVTIYDEIVPQFFRSLSGLELWKALGNLRFPFTSKESIPCFQESGQDLPGFHF